MTPEQMYLARKSLGLTLDQMAVALGYQGMSARSQMHHLETGRREIRPAQRLLVEAYLDGWRPKSWPSGK